MPAIFRATPWWSVHVIAFQKPPPSRRLLKGLVHHRTGTQLHREKRKRTLFRINEGTCNDAGKLLGSGDGISGHQPVVRGPLVVCEVRKVGDRWSSHNIPLSQNLI
ncbi:hypothetical protein QTO34_003657 [Cnephaeus nilssonii]|uniref:Uncharacterized protein n=1 Tax=Cnephaeus nilssonii TaxID=3371016 RepID=A0AA40HR29_CNENI|nr:hypothetical protein QTO34_003657 [Eptesicus nilssonii]